MEAKGPITCARFSGPTKLLVSAGEAAGTADDERGCGAKVRTRVGDARKFLRNYAMVNVSGGAPANTRGLLHRVIFHGDRVEMTVELIRAI